MPRARCGSVLIRLLLFGVLGPVSLLVGLEGLVCSHNDGSPCGERVDSCLTFQGFQAKGISPEHLAGLRIRVIQDGIIGDNVGGQHDVRFRKEKHNPELNGVIEINDELDRHGGTNPCIVGGAFDGVDREVALCTPALGCSNSAGNHSSPHDVVSCGLAGSMIQLARSISHWQKLQSSLASVLREEFPEDGLRKGILVSADVAISIDAAGVSLASTNLDDNPLLVVFRGRWMLDARTVNLHFGSQAKIFNSVLYPMLLWVFLLNLSHNWRTSTK